MFRKQVSIVIFLLVTILAAWALASDKEGEGRGFFIVGQHKIDVGDLSTALTNHGYGQVDNNFLSMGGCGLAIIKDRLVIGGEGHGLFGDEHSSNGYNVSFMGAYGMFNIGIVAWKKGPFQLYPLFGLGGGGFNLKIVEQQGAPFEEMLRQPKRGMELDTGGLIMGAALGADYLVNLSNNPDEIGGIALGIRVGYNYSTIIGKWTFEDKEISGGPEIGITGPYLQFMIGGGGRSKK